MRICSHPRRHPRRSSIQIHRLELISLSVLYGLRELVLLRSALYVGACLHSLPIVQIASKALHDANDALLGVHCITRITRPHVHCLSDPRFGALSPTKLREMSLSTTTPPSL